MAYDEQLAERIRELVSNEDGLTEKKMFGGLAFLINGNMSVSASGQGGLLLRVDPEQTDALLEEPHAEPFVMRGRAMDGWLRVGADGLDRDEDLRRWVAVGVGYARALIDAFGRAARQAASSGAQRCAARLSTDPADQGVVQHPFA